MPDRRPARSRNLTTAHNTGRSYEHTQIGDDGWMGGGVGGLFGRQYDRLAAGHRTDDDGAGGATGRRPTAGAACGGRAVSGVRAPRSTFLKDRRLRVASASAGKSSRHGIAGALFTLDNLHILRARVPAVLAAGADRDRCRPSRPGANRLRPGRRSDLDSGRRGAAREAAGLLRCPHLELLAADPGAVSRPSPTGDGCRSAAPATAGSLRC
jgi:hypothetical protein